MPIFKHDINPLKIPSVTINTAGTLSAITKEHDVVKRVGLFLQRVLQNKYGNVYRDSLLTRSVEESQAIMKKRNPLLAHLTPKDALASLKSEFKDFIAQNDPFQRRFRSDENIQKWSMVVQKDEFAHVLGVRRAACLCRVSNVILLVSQALAIKIFSAVPSSIFDERTMLVVTWLNAPKQSRQSVATIFDHLRIIQWYQFQEDTEGGKVC